MEAPHIHHAPFFQEYPILGCLYTISLAVIGNTLPLVAGDSHIPPIVMEILQCVVWASGSLVGIFTLYGMWKKSKEK